MATATIKITIEPFTTPFRPVEAPPESPPPIANCTVIGMSLDSGPGHVTVTGPYETPPNTIRVSGAEPVRLTFVVVDPEGGSYFESGLVFAQSTATTTGHDNFPSFMVDACGLAITDTAAFHSDYEFALLVQNSNYGLGLIDPKISNVSPTVPPPSP